MIVTSSEPFEVMPCPDCSIRFAMPADFVTARRADKRSFFCPNGHSLSYKESETDRLRRERDRLKQQAAQKDDELRSARDAIIAQQLRAERAEKKAHASLKRNAAGVCPCCSRSFQALRSHMRTKHPNFKAEVVPLKATA